MGSVEGTWVNGKRVNKGSIAFGDEIRVGNTLIRGRGRGRCPGCCRGRRCRRCCADDQRERELLSRAGPRRGRPRAGRCAGGASLRGAHAATGRGVRSLRRPRRRPPLRRLPPRRRLRPAPRSPIPPAIIPGPTLTTTWRTGRISMPGSGGAAQGRWPAGAQRCASAWGDRILSEQLRPRPQGRVQRRHRAGRGPGDGRPARPARRASSSSPPTGRADSPSTSPGRWAARSSGRGPHRHPDAGHRVEHGPATTDSYAIALEPDDIALVDLGGGGGPLLPADAA